MAKETYLIEGINVPIQSKEEWMFIYWLKEAVTYGYVEPGWEFQLPPIVLAEPQYVMQTIVKQLKTKVKVTEKRKEILKGVEYNPDFKFRVTSKFLKTFPNVFFITNPAVWVDTKGGFAGPHNNSAITFPVKQKWLFQKEGVYVQKVVPKQFFKKTWVPERVCLTYKTLKPCKTFEEGYKTVKEIEGE